MIKRNFILQISYTYLSNDILKIIQEIIECRDQILIIITIN